MSRGRATVIYCVVRRNLARLPAGKSPHECIVVTEIPSLSQSGSCGTLIPAPVDELATVPTIAWDLEDWEHSRRVIPRAGSPCRERIRRWISKSSLGWIKEKRRFHSWKANVEATGLLRLSGASLVSMVQSTDLRNRYHAPLFRRFHCPGLRGVFAQG